LFGDPLGNVLGEDEADDEADNIGEEAANTTLNDRHGDAIAKTQERQHAAPRYTTVAKQPANKPATTLHSTAHTFNPLTPIVAIWVQL